MKQLMTNRMMGMFGLVLLSVLMVGCNDELKAEHARLTQENQELRGQLDSAQTALADATTDRERLMGELAAAKQAPPPPAETGSAKSGFEDIGDGVTVEQGAGQITVRIPGDVLFDSGKVALKSTAKRTLQRITQVISSQYPGNMIRVEGHSDSDPIRKSKWKDNLELSANRAMTVHRYLLQLGVRPKNLYSAGFSDVKPRGTKAQSRRVEIVVIQ